MTISIVCGLEDVRVTTTRFSYTYIVGEPGFQLDPVFFTEVPGCNHPRTVTPTVPTFITWTFDDAQDKFNIDLQAFNDNTLEG